MDFLNLILKQVEQLLGRELSEAERNNAINKIEDDAKAIELYISSIAKKYVRYIHDSRN